MAEIPNRLVATFHVQMTSHLLRAHALFRSGNQSDRHEPFGERKVRLVEYGSGLRRELVSVAASALIHASKQTARRNVLAILAATGLDPHFGYVHATALDAANARGPTHLDEMV